MDTIEFTVYGPPKAQKRHRTFTKNKRGRHLARPIKLDPSKSDKMSFLAQVVQLRPEAPWDCPIELQITWVMPRPKSHYGTGANVGKLKPSAPMFCTSLRRGDSDNLEKLVCDAMNGVFYRDDSLIARVQKEKIYDPRVPERPRTIVVLRKLAERISNALSTTTG